MIRTLPTPDLKKARKVVSHVLSKHGPMTEKELTALLYFIDFDYYERYEEQLMGLTYIKDED